MPTGAALAARTDSPLASDAENEQSYARLLRSLKTSRGQFAFYPLRSNYCLLLRDQLLDRLELDLRGAGMQLQRITLTRDSWDPLDYLPSAGDDTSNRVYVLLGWEHTPGLSALPFRTDNRPPALGRMNIARDAVEARFRCPVIVWCTPDVYRQFARHAPDMLDHYTAFPEFILPLVVSPDFDLPLAKEPGHSDPRLPSDTLLHLGGRAVREDWEGPCLRREGLELVSQATRNGAKEALGHAMSAVTETVQSRETPFVHAVGPLLAAKSGMLGADEAILRIPVAVADALDERRDRESLHEAVRHYQAAQRASGDVEDEMRAQTRIGEAIPRQKPAALGETPATQFANADRFHAEGANVYQPGSPEWGAIQRNRAHSLRAWARWLAGAGQAVEAATRRARAFEFVRDGIAILERQRLGLARRQERADFLATVARQYAELVDLCLEMSETAASPDEAEQFRLEAWHTVHLAKARTLLERVAVGGAHLAAEDQWLWDKLDASGELLARLERDELVRRRQPSPPPGRVDRIEEALLGYQRNRAFLLEGLDLTRVREAPGPAEPGDILAAFRQASRPGQRTLLVEYFCLSEGELAVFLGPVWREGAGTQVVRVSLPEPLAQLIGPPVELAHHAAADSRADMDLGARMVRSATLVTRGWVEFVQAQGWEPTEVVVSAHAGVGLLPLHAAEHDGVPLAERWPISYVPTPALVPEWVRRRDVGGFSGRRSAPRPALVVGAAEAEGFPEPWLHPGAHGELRSIAEQLGASGQNVVLLSGTEATARRLIQASGEAPWLFHFAGASTDQPDDVLRSGLELADRRLTVFDVETRLNFQMTDLVYLSACEQQTVGAGDDERSTERAFLAAGASSVISSLWPLNDEVALFFAQEFYRGWLTDRLPLNAAFRRAQLSTREEFPDPLHWAPFVLLGAWSNPAH